MKATNWEPSPVNGGLDETCNTRLAVRVPTGCFHERGLGGLHTNGARLLLFC